MIIRAYRSHMRHVNTQYYWAYWLGLWLATEVILVIIKPKPTNGLILFAQLYLILGCVEVLLINATGLCVFIVDRNKKRLRPQEDENGLAACGRGFAFGLVVSVVAPIYTVFWVTILLPVRSALWVKRFIPHVIALRRLLLLSVPFIQERIDSGTTNVDQAYRHVTEVIFVQAVKLEITDEDERVELSELLKDDFRRRVFSNQRKSVAYVYREARLMVVDEFGERIADDLCNRYPSLYEPLTYRLRRKIGIGAMVSAGIVVLTLACNILQLAAARLTLIQGIGLFMLVIGTAMVAGVIRGRYHSRT